MKLQTISSHSVGNLLACRCEHASNANERAQDRRRHTHQADEGNHLVERLDLVILVLSLINESKSSAIEEFTNDVKGVPVALFSSDFLTV